MPEELVAATTGGEAPPPRGRRTFEEALADWKAWLAVEPPVESADDARVLALTDLRFDDALQATLSDLLDANREGELDQAGRRRLEDVMAVYGAGQLLKSSALVVAVKRGLRPRLS